MWREREGVMGERIGEEEREWKDPGGKRRGDRDGRMRERGTRSRKSYI